VTTRVDRSIVVDVPVHTAYDQWTRFPDFPPSCQGWSRSSGSVTLSPAGPPRSPACDGNGRPRSSSRYPTRRPPGAATTGVRNAGVAYFEAVDDTRTRVRLTLDFEPEGMVERVGDALDVIKRRTVADLHRFKEFIESHRGAEVASDHRSGVRAPTPQTRTPRAMAVGAEGSRTPGGNGARHHRLGDRHVASADAAGGPQRPSFGPVST
jgi:hypothetical protein